MRLLSLDLERYGAFTDRHIVFRAHAPLHVVYGRNEAGKSTALAAIADLLFGFPERGGFNFLHANPQLRIGARIANSRGDELTFRRRRGRNRTLIDADDQPLRDDALTPFLGGLTREIFLHAFGLSTKALQEGGREMLDERGDVGSALFAAASGLRGTTALKRSLDDEAEQIFDIKRANHRRFYQALDRHEAARKAMREKELRSGEWKELNAKVDTLAGELAEVDARRTRRAQDRARLTRLKRLAPLIAIIDMRLAGIAALPPVPIVSPGFAERLRVAVAAEVEAARRQRDATAAVERLERERDALDVDETIVAHVADITAIHAETGRYTKAKEDLPGVARHAESLRLDLADRALRLGLADWQDIRHRRPRDTDLATLRGLVRDGRDLAARMTATRAERDAERDGLATLLRARQESGGTIVDPSLLRERLTTLGPALRRAAERSGITSAIAREETLIAEATARLDPQIASLDALAKAALPDTETIMRFRQVGEQCDKSVDRARAEVETVRREQREIELALERQIAARPVPTPDAIAAMRASRDAAWDAVRPALFGAAMKPEALSVSIAAFERSTVEADRLADEAMADAGRVAEHAVETKRLADKRARHATALDLLGEAEARHRTHLEAWNAVWERHGVAPRTPNEMGRWLDTVATLLGRRAELAAQRARLDTVDADIGFLMPELRRIAASIGLAEIDDAAAHQIAEQLEERLRRLSAAWDQARDRETRINDAAARVERAEERLAEAKRQSAGWAKHWRLALPAVGLDASATPDAADAAIQGWSEVPAMAANFAKEDHRVAGMRRDNANFEDRAEILIKAVAPDLAGRPVETALRVINDRATAATATAARRGDCVARLAEAHRVFQEAAMATKQARLVLAALAAEASLDTLPDPTALLTALDTHARLAADLRDRREQFVDAADGFGESELRSELTDFDAEVVEGKLAGLLQEEEDLAGEREGLLVRRHNAFQERNARALGVGAELAAQLRRNAEAELASVAREWAVLKLGALLLGKAIERHRAAAQNPLVTRAGEFFALLTAGAFANLGSRYDDNDTAVLVGRRADGTEVGVESLSEGTRDQLFLSLRLAYLESYAANAEPPPFVADDLFASFDDERTGHGLTALASLRSPTQCILFTHHRRVVEIAHERLGETLDVIDLAN